MRRAAGSAIAVSAATWRNAQGDVLRSAYAASLCWFPRRPHWLQASVDDYSIALPCRACPGCYEYARIVLAERLSAKYQAGQTSRASRRTRQRGSKRKVSDSNPAKLWLARIFAPKEHHDRIKRRFVRARSTQVEPWFGRYGNSSFGILTTTPAAVRAVARRLELDHKVIPIQLARGRRAWRPVTSGLLVDRSVYGEQVKRFYARGLPRQEKETWTVARSNQHRDHATGEYPRAWARDHVSLFPPELWGLRRTRPGNLRRDFSCARSPEAVQLLIKLQQQIGKPLLRTMNVSAGPASAEDQERNRQFNLKMAGGVTAARSEGPNPETRSPVFRASVTEVPDIVKENQPPVLPPIERLAIELSKPPPAWMAETRDSDRKRREAEAARAGKRAAAWRAMLDRLKSKFGEK